MTQPIKIKVGDTVQKTETKMSLVARKSIDGNILIMDHNDIDIVVLPEKKKIIAFPKKSLQDSVYSTQDRLFNYLGTKGVIKRESVRSGNVYGSMEAEIPEPVAGINPIQISVFTIGKFIEEEKPHMDMDEYIQDEFEERLTEPEGDESTELGEVPQRAIKGSLPKDANMYKTRRWYAPGA